MAQNRRFRGAHMTHDARTEVERPDTKVGTYLSVSSEGVSSTPTPRVKKYGRPWYRLSKEERQRIKWDEVKALQANREGFTDHHLVYFIQEPNTKAIKIGIARDPQFRLRRLQTAHPSDLVLLGTCRGGSTFEKLLHLEFSASQIRREWFHETPELLAKIEELCK